MGYDYILLNLNTLKIVKRLFRTLIFNSCTEARKYADSLGIQVKVIQL